MLKPERYQIHTRPAPRPAAGHAAQFLLIEGDSYVKYGRPAFANTSHRGDEHWTPEVISQTWYQAETGEIPISGAGYGGKFAGKGFEGIWLDMSEIVRPTRDGIHGRETISTQVDLGGRLMALEFSPSGELITELPPGISLPLPILFNPLPMQLPGRAALRALALAAAELDTLAIWDPVDYDEDLADQAYWLAPRLDADSFEHIPASWRPRYVEIELEIDQDPAATLELVDRARERWPGAVVAARLELAEGASGIAIDWVQAGLRVLHLYADDVAEDLDGRTLPDALQDVHLSLIKAGLRDRATLVVSGGIAAAEHLPKAISCGADLVAIDYILPVAWGCALWADKGTCPVERNGIADANWGAQRVVNLMNAWRDQLLEVLGAMGMREVRRMRGETGRTIWHRREEDAFRSILGGRVALSRYRRLPEPSEGEGDFRWPQPLLMATQEQARTGQPPGGDLEYRVGQSDGGFDRLAFAFELDWEPDDVIAADPAGFDMSLSLNRLEDGRPATVIPVPWYGAGMSYGSVSEPVMLARARAAREQGTFCSTGEGGYPEALAPYADNIITQVATGLFGVREETIQRAPIVEIKYAQGAKPGLGGHLLGGKNTASVARIREAVEGTSLFSPFPFHSVYSVEDHKKHLDWLKQISPRSLISVKVSTPTDVDMVAVGSYYAGAHIVHLDGAYGGTGAAPEIAKKNIAMPIEYALPKVHRFLQAEGVRDRVTLMASGGLRSAYDVAKAIALGADGAILGTAELVAIGCLRVAQCEKGLGCPLGITTTDPEHAKLIDASQAWKRIVNLYQAWLWQLAGMLEILGMRSIAELRGRSDLLVYLEEELS
jgi:glutamate synthase domain-containing protein 2